MADWDAIEAEQDAADREAVRRAGERWRAQERANRDADREALARAAERSHLSVVPEAVQDAPGQAETPPPVSQPIQAPWAPPPPAPPENPLLPPPGVYWNQGRRYEQSRVIPAVVGFRLVLRQLRASMERAGYPDPGDNGAQADQ